MNKRAKFLIIAALLPLSIFIPVYLAQTISLDSQVYAQQSTLQERIEDYKTKLEARATKGDLDRLKLRCSVAQTVLKNLQSKVASNQENRTKVYTKIDDTLKQLTTTLKEKSISTTKLEQETKELEKKIDAYKKTSQAYKQAVEDSANTDCTQDPLALKAAIQESRRTHDELINQVAEIRTYVNNVIKPTLVQIKADIKTQQKASSTNSAEGAENATQQ